MENSETRVEFERDQPEHDDVASRLFDCLEEGGMMKDFKGVSDEQMEAIYAAGHQLYSSGNFLGALKVFRYLGLHDHLNKKYLFALGSCEKMTKEYKTAIELFSLSALLDINDPTSLFQIGDCYLALGDPEKAHEAFSAAVHFAENSTQDNDQLIADSKLKLELAARKISRGNKNECGFD